MFTGLVAGLGPQYLVASSVALHALNAALLARIALLLWPGRTGLAGLAGLLAGIWPQVIGTVLDPLNQPYLVCAAFYLIAIIVFEAGLRREQWSLVGLAGCCFACAALSLELNSCVVPPDRRVRGVAAPRRSRSPSGSGRLRSHPAACA